MTSTMVHNLKKLFATSAAVIFWLLVWQLCAVLVGREVILPSPLSVFKRFFELCITAPFWKATAISIIRIMCGYLVGVTAGVLLGIAMYFSPVVRTMFSPFLTVVKSTPVASFILVAYFIITDTAIPVFITFLMVLPIIASSVFTSLGSTDKDLLEMTKMYKFSFAEKLKNLYLPTVMPHFVGQALTSLGLGWKAGIAAEVLCTPAGTIGKYLYSAKNYLETVDTFAYTLLVVFISLCLELVLKKLLRRVLGGAV